MQRRSQSGNATLVCKYAKFTRKLKLILNATIIHYQTKPSDKPFTNVFLKCIRPPPPFPCATAYGRRSVPPLIPELKVQYVQYIYVNNWPKCLLSEKNWSVLKPTSTTAYYIHLPVVMASYNDAIAIHWQFIRSSTLVLQTGATSSGIAKQSQ